MSSCCNTYISIGFDSISDKHKIFITHTYTSYSCYSCYTCDSSFFGRPLFFAAAYPCPKSIRCSSEFSTTSTVFLVSGFESFTFFPDALFQLGIFPPLAFWWFLRTFAFAVSHGTPLLVLLLCCSPFRETTRQQLVNHLPFAEKDLCLILADDCCELCFYLLRSTRSLEVLNLLYRLEAGSV